MWTGCSDRSSGCIWRKSFPGPGSGWRRCSASSTGMAAGCGRKAWWGRGPPFTSPSAGCGAELADLLHGLPEDVHRFLYQNIDSVEQLEVLLYLRQSPERGWSSEDVARALYSHPSSV